MWHRCRFVSVSSVSGPGVHSHDHRCGYRAGGGGGTGPQLGLPAPDGRRLHQDRRRLARLQAGGRIVFPKLAEPAPGPRPAPGLTRYDPIHSERAGVPAQATPPAPPGEALAVLSAVLERDGWPLRQICPFCAREPMGWVCFPQSDKGVKLCRAGLPSAAGVRCCRVFIIGRTGYSWCRSRGRRRVRRNCL